MKYKKDEIWQVRTEMFEFRNSIGTKAKKKDRVCGECSKEYEIGEMVGMMTIHGKSTIHLCTSCGNKYIELGAIDINENRRIRSQLESKIYALNKYEKLEGIETCNLQPIIDRLEKANSLNDYNHEIVADISKKTHLSQIALFTRLLFENKVSKTNYNKIKSDFDEKYKAREEETKKLRELEKQNGKKAGGAVPKPINSPLFISTIQTAYYEGIINEYEVCKKLNIKPEKLEKYIQ